jgi:hypothetical protein
MLRSILPYLGDEKAVKRLKKLDRKVITVLAVVGMMFSKAIEGVISVLIQVQPVVVWGVDFSQLFWYTLTGTILVLLVIFGFDQFVDEAADEIEEELR